MKILTCNVGYLLGDRGATGAVLPSLARLVTGHEPTERRAIERLGALLEREQPDVACLVELGAEVIGHRRDQPSVRAYREWVHALVGASAPLRRRDLHPPVQFGNSVVNWTNKARLLPVRNVAIRVVPIVLLVLVVGMLFRRL